MNILVIDDDPFVLKLLPHQLTSLGFPKVTTCQRAEQALTILQAAADSVELVFCDIQMPEMDGVELIRHLARLGYQGGLVLMSGENERILHAVQCLALAHELKVLDALRKPLLPAQLRLIVEQQQAGAGQGRPPAKRSYGAEAIREAITRGELVNYYQPKVSVRTGELVGVETLVRWQHPLDGLVYPDQFIAPAEQFGLIDALTRTVLLNAMRQSHAWRDAGLQLNVAVNISMHNLESLDFPGFVVDAVKDAGVEPASLVLEITESQLMRKPQAALETLTRLCLKNITLSIDDFGTGHSSLAQLRDIPFCELKVDRGFVHDAGRCALRRVILDASLDMARRLGMQSVAEGVENLDDWRLLVDEARCDLAQGYFIARPMPAAELQDWARGWEVRRQGLMRPEGVS